jgi:hypothetical protein
MAHPHKQGVVPQVLSMHTAIISTVLLCLPPHMRASPLLTLVHLPIYLQVGVRCSLEQMLEEVRE